MFTKKSMKLLCIVELLNKDRIPLKTGHFHLSQMPHLATVVQDLSILPSRLENYIMSDVGSFPSCVCVCV